MAGDSNASPPTIPGLAQVIGEAHGRLPGATARTVEHLHRLHTASEAVDEAESIRRRAASRERSALLRAATLAGFSEHEAQRRLVTAGAAARRLGITRERLRQLAEAEAIGCFKTSLGRVYLSEDLDRAIAAGWTRRQPATRHCCASGCNATALDVWEYTIVPDVEIMIALCASHIAAVVAQQQAR
jgi:hypothetical protein